MFLKISFVRDCFHVIKFDLLLYMNINILIFFGSNIKVWFNH